MKRFFITLFILLAAAGVAVLTCPDKVTHKNAIMSVINQQINEEASEGVSSGYEGMAIFAGALSSRLLEVVLDNRLTVKNNFVYSVGYIQHFSGENERVSIGVFGHVFTFSKEDLDRALEKNKQQ